MDKLKIDLYKHPLSRVYQKIIKKVPTTNGFGESFTVGDYRFLKIQSSDKFILQLHYKEHTWIGTLYLSKDSFGVTSNFNIHFTNKAIFIGLSNLK